MKSQKLTKPSTDTSAVSHASGKGVFEARSFVMQKQTADNSQQPDLQASLMRAERYGHHLHRMQPTKQVFPVKAPQVIQNTSAVIQPMFPKKPATVNRYQENPQERTLAPITKDQYDSLSEDDYKTEERGYKNFQLNDLNEKPNWEINDKLMRWENNNVLSKKGNPKLPVSCIESAEHIVNYGNDVRIPDYDTSQASDKNVDLHLSQNQRNKKALNISTQALSELNMSEYEDFDFAQSPIKVNQGIIAINQDDPESMVHAIAATAVNNEQGQFIALERNAGTTTGDNDYTDDKGLFNSYNSVDKFKESMGNEVNYKYGKLKKAQSRS